MSLPGIALDFVKGSQAAKKDGDPFDRAVRALALLAAGGKKVEPVDADALAALLPATVAGMPKGPMLASGETQHGLQGTIARAIYESEGTKITLEVGDMGEFAGAARALARFDPAVEKTFDWGYRRSYWADGNYVREEHFRSDRIGTVGMMVAGRFMIGARGSGVEPAQLLKRFVRSTRVKLARLAN